MIPPLLALLLWIPLSVFLFRRFPIRVALLITFLGGWAILPGAHFVPSQAEDPYWILSASLPASYFLTKGTIVSIAALLGAWSIDRRFYKRFELTFWDLPMLAWCVVPLLAGIANQPYLAEGIRGMLYQTLAWGVPYFFGRLYFSNTEALRLASKAFVIAGLLYIPLCLVEIFTGPQFYAHIYGYEPYRWSKAVRYLGFRPIGFMEDGNQLGMWMATATLIACWLWRRSSVTRVLRIPIAVATTLLFTVTILCQSTGSILLLLAALPFVFLRQRYLPRVATVLLVLGILAFAGIRLDNRMSMRKLVRKNPAIHATARFLKEIKRGSFEWRLGQDERHVGQALSNPVLGSGQWNWWQQGVGRPWGLWMLTFGMYGFFGLGALYCLLLLPVARVVWFPLARSDIEAFSLRHALGAAILMSTIDSLLNSSFLLPLLVVVGGMSTWTSAASEIPVEYTQPLLPASTSTPDGDVDEEQHAGGREL